MAHLLMPERTHFRSTGATLDAEMRQKALAAGVEYISAWDAFCNPDGCLTRVGKDGKDITAWDDAHLSVAGSIYLANAIKSQLFPDLPFSSVPAQQ
jgi:hypothetical protein